MSTIDRKPGGPPACWPNPGEPSWPTSGGGNGQDTSPGPGPCKGLPAEGQPDGGQPVQPSVPGRTAASRSHAEVGTQPPRRAVRARR